LSWIQSRQFRESHDTERTDRRTRRCIGRLNRLRYTEIRWGRTAGYDRRQFLRPGRTRPACPRTTTAEHGTPESVRQPAGTPRGRPGTLCAGCRRRPGACTHLKRVRSGACTHPNSGSPRRCSVPWTSGSARESPDSERS